MQCDSRKVARRKLAEAIKREGGLSVLNLTTMARQAIGLIFGGVGQASNCSIRSGARNQPIMITAIAMQAVPVPGFQTAHIYGRRCFRGTTGGAQMLQHQALLLRIIRPVWTTHARDVTGVYRIANGLLMSLKATLSMAPDRIRDEG